MTNDNQKTYSIAFVRADGEWDVVESFIADSDEDANAHAESKYSGAEWFVLGPLGNNINGDGR